MADVPAVAPASAGAVTQPGAQTGTGTQPNPKVAESPEPEFEVKVDGQLKKYKKTEAEKLLSKAGYADKTIRQAKEYMRKLQAQEAELQRQLAEAKDPERFFKTSGLSEEEFARKVLERKIAEAQLSPEERERQELQAQLAEAREQLEKRQGDEAEAQQAQLVTQIQKRMEEDLFAAAQRAGMPNDADSFYAIYQAMQEAHDLNLPYDPDRIVEVAMENIDATFKRLEESTLKSLKGKALVDRLGPAIVKEVLRFKAEEIRGGRGIQQAKPANDNVETPAKKSSDYLTPAQYKAELKKLGGNR